MTKQMPPMPVPKKAGSSSDRWVETKQEVKQEQDSEEDEDEFQDAEDGSGSSWLTNDCPKLPEALNSLVIQAMSTYMEDLVILEG